MAAATRDGVATEGNGPVLAMVMATATLVGIVLSVSHPLLSLVLHHHGYPDGLIGLNASAHAFGVFVVAPFIGPLLRLGASRAMILALVATALSLVLLALKVDLWLWYGLRLILSGAFAMLFIMSESAVNALTSEATRGRVIGLYGTFFSVGYVGGPAIIATLGSEGWPPFIACLVLLALGVVPLLFARAVDDALRGDAGHRTDFLGKLRLTPFVFLVAFAFGFMENAQFAMAPLWAMDGGLSETVASVGLMVFIAGNILLQYPVGWAGDRFGRVRTILGLCAVAILSGLLLNLGLRGGWLLWPMLLVFGGTIGSLYSSGLSLLGMLYGREQLAAANTVFVMMVQCGVAAGPLVAGFAMQGIGSWTLPVVVAACGLALVLSRGVPALR